VSAGEFREDLFHRLDLYRINLPPLRARGPDILTLAEQLMTCVCQRHRLPPRQITRTGQQRLLTYRWPGNVRELAHELERALVFEDAAQLDFAHLPAQDSVPGLPNPTPETGPPADWLYPGFLFPEEGFQLEDAINRLVQLALKQADQNITRAARLLGVTRDFIRYRLFGDRKGKDQPPSPDSHIEP
jgi:DNA-binding NtrC family response regulator